MRLTSYNLDELNDLIGGKHMQLKKQKDIIKNSNRFDFNCWCTTLILHKEIDNVNWTDCSTMDKWLKTNTNIIDVKNLKHGDIMVLRKDDELIHTALYLGKDVWAHKAGMNAYEEVGYDKVLWWYDGSYDEEVWFNKIEYCRRIK